MHPDAVIFDWGGTLTPWHDIDFAGEARALAAAVRRDPGAADLREEHAARLVEAAASVWGRSRDHQRSATVEAVFAEAGLDHDPDRLADYRAFWEPHTRTDPEAAPMLRALRERGIRIGVLSNTIWPRAWHREIFERDRVADLIDADVYTSELPWTKPAPEAFAAALAAVGASNPARCVYVGDRLYDDIWGAQRAGMRTIHLPHSTIPPTQRGPAEGVPDAVARRLAEIPDILDSRL